MNQTNQPDLSEGYLDSLMKSRLPLPVAEKLGVGQQLARSLLKPDHFLHYLTVFRKLAEREGGCVYLLTIHQHSPRVSLQRAVQAATGAVNSLNNFRWSHLAQQRGSWLSRAATPFAAIGAVIPERDEEACWHTHGCLYLPLGPGGELTEDRDLTAALSLYRNSDNQIRILHDGAVHAQEIPLQEDLRPIAAYATHGWRTCPPEHRILELVPAAKAGRHLARRWREVTAEFEVLQAELEMHWAWEHHRRDQRCVELRSEFLRRARAISRAGRRERS